MKVYWLEQTEADVPEGNDWLNAREFDFLSCLRFAKRRADWRLGRWTAKRALSVCLNLPKSPAEFAKIEIWPLSSGAPEVRFENQPASVTISLSHRVNRAACAIAPAAVQLGCDVELVEPRSDAFISDYFTSVEQNMIARQPVETRPRLSALLWSAKESALKALHAGLRLDTRSVTVEPGGLSLDIHDWSPLLVRCASGQIFHGWWQTTDNFVRSVVADPAPASPISLRITAASPGSVRRNLSWGKGGADGGQSPFPWPGPVSTSKRKRARPIGP
jgi:4'-phosphopantetheinyl transferase